MSDRYRVKATHGDTTIYGIANMHSEEGERAKADGKLLITDAVFPKSYIVPLNLVVDIPFSIPKFKPGTMDLDPQDDFERYVNEQEKLHHAASAQAGPGVQVGKLFNVGVADGCAWYVVTKVTKKTVKVEWRGFCADRYVDHWLGWGGTFPLSKIEPLVRRQEALSKLFSKKTG